MPIRLSQSCTHCQALTSSSVCSVHEIKVNENYTCDQFSIRPQLATSRHCGSCARYKGESCAHPAKAAEGMLCASWAPQA